MDGAIKTQLHFRAYCKTQEELLPLGVPEGIAGSSCAISSKSVIYIFMYISFCNWSFKMDTQKEAETVTWFPVNSLWCLLVHLGYNQVLQREVEVKRGRFLNLHNPSIPIRKHPTVLLMLSLYVSFVQHLYSHLWIYFHYFIPFFSHCLFLTEIYFSLSFQLW